jgi:hypothetical protein
MTRNNGSFRKIVAAFLLSIMMSSCPLWAQTAHHEQSGSMDTTLIAQGLGASGAWTAGEGVYKVSFPRTDVKVKVDGLELPPFMGLTTWVGFQQDGQSTMVMGDLVLFQDEVNPVMSALLDGGLAVTALHNHFFYSEPTVYFMHIDGDGKLDGVVKTVRGALDEVKRIRTEYPTPSTGFGSSDDINTSNLTAAPIEQIIGAKGIAQKGMLKFVVGRTVRMPGGCTAGKEMGVNTWAALMGSDAHAVIDGDFATSEGELQPVLKSLRHSGTNIVAIHSHMEGETPRLIFLHYWGAGPAAQLAQGFKSALDAQAAAAKAGR